MARIRTRGRVLGCVALNGAASSSSSKGRTGTCGGLSNGATTTYGAAATEPGGAAKDIAA